MGLSELLQQLAANSTQSTDVVAPEQPATSTDAPTYTMYTDPATGNTIYMDASTGSVVYTDTSTAQMAVQPEPAAITAPSPPSLPPGSTVCYTVPQSGGGASYVKLLGRSRKIIQEGRRKFVNIKGKKVSITVARQMDKEAKADARKKTPKSK